MSWARVDDHANEHPKLLQVGGEAAWLWVCGLMYANRQKRRDGLIPKGVLGMLYPFKSAKRLAAKLVESGLWVELESAYEIHNYLVWNAPTEQIESNREKTRVRVARHRANKARSEHGNAVTPSQRNCVTVTNVLDPLHSTPLPDPKAAEVDPNLSGHGEPDTPRVSAAAAPTSFEESLRVPIAERARIVERDPSLGQWFQAHRWPEVVELATAWGDTRLGQYGQDSGVRAAVALFAIPFELHELLQAVPRIRGSDWARGKKLGLSCMTPAVVRTALNERDKPDDGLTPEQRIELKFSEAKQRRADEARARERAARGGSNAVSKS